MSEATPEQLFRRWAELEPERCRESEQMFDVLLGSSWVSVFSLQIGVILLPIGWGVVQSAVMLAIHERELRFRMTDTSNLISGVSCYEIDVLTDEFEEIVSNDYHAPEYGLLACYLDALEVLEAIADEEVKPLKVLVSLEEYRALQQLEQPCTVEQLQAILKDERASQIFSATFHDREVEVVVKQEGGTSSESR